MGKSIVWQNNRTGVKGKKDISRVFLMIGASPHTKWLPKSICKDDHGFVYTGREAETSANNHAEGMKGWPRERPPYAMETSVPGIFAVGDVVSNSVKRVASAVGFGAVSVSYVFKFLEDQARLEHEDNEE